MVEMMIILGGGDTSYLYIILKKEGEHDGWV
jgi:hypothetical protein